MGGWGRDGREGGRGRDGGETVGWEGKRKGW